MSRRIGRWTYGNHEGLNPGWRLDDTDLVLDYDPLDTSGERRGCYTLWVGGVPTEPIDHYLAGAMDFVEQEFRPASLGATDGEASDG